ncbi:MAG: phosphate-selective porin OprO/OprP [Dinoroseobacter sp.]|jgi:phosphate-selective porin OprO/OprP
MKMKMKIRLLVSLVTVTLGFVATANAETKVSTAGGLKVTSGDYEFKFGGRIMYDYNKSEKNGVTDEDGFDLRRGRVYASGKIAKDWAFKSQFNVNGGGVEDLYLRYTGFGEMANVTIGNQKVPFGLEELTSSKDISVLERSAITEQYAIGRAESVQLHGVLGGNSTYAISAFAVDQDDSNDDEIGFAARYTIAPIKSDNAVVHLGLAYRDIADSDAFGVELAATSGSFHIQAEYANGDLGTDSLDGYYVQAGYIFTGESRPYSKGVFKRVNPNGKAGAWEAVVRYEDGDGNHSDIELGRTDATAYTVGLNWYAHKNVRLGINYTDGEDNNDDDDGNEFRVRFQLTF